MSAARLHVLDAPPPFASSLDRLGPIAALDRLDRIERETGGDGASRREARWIFGRLDARPGHRRVRADVAFRLGVGPQPPPDRAFTVRRLTSPEAEHWILLKTGKFAEAELLARARAAKLPPIEGAALVAETQWRAGNHDGAARTLTQLGRVERRAAWPIGLAFVNVFPLRTSGTPELDPGPARRAAKALVNASVHASVLREVGQISLDFGAIDVGQMLYDVVLASLPPSIEREGIMLELIAHLARAKGEKPPVAPPSPLSAWTAPMAYEQGLAVVPARIAGPSETEELDALLSIATRRALRPPPGEGAARTILVHGRTRFAVLGRHLLGLETEETVRRLPTNPRERCEAAYYLAVAADARGDAEAATAWLQLSLDEGSPEIAEWRWARAKSFVASP